MVLLCICLFNYIFVVLPSHSSYYISYTLNTSLSLIDMSKYNLKGGKEFSTLRTNINKNYS